MLSESRLGHDPWHCSPPPRLAEMLFKTNVAARSQLFALTAIVFRNILGVLPQNSKLIQTKISLKKPTNDPF
jgi:hypothetical protein